MTKWIDIGPEKDIVPGGRLSVSVQGQAVVVFHVNGQLHAVEDCCTHAQLPLREGELAGCTLTCPYHGFAFNIATGKNVDDPNDTALKTYPVKIEAGRLLLSVETLF